MSFSEGFLFELFGVSGLSCRFAGQQLNTSLLLVFAIQVGLVSPKTAYFLLRLFACICMYMDIYLGRELCQHEIEQKEWILSYMHVSINLRQITLTIGCITIGYWFSTIMLYSICQIRPGMLDQAGRGHWTCYAQFVRYLCSFALYMP